MASKMLLFFLISRQFIDINAVCQDRDKWSYNQPNTDPPNWGNNFPFCRRLGNAQQSPINIITNHVLAKESFNIRHNYWLPAKPNTFYTVKNEGRTIKMDFHETDYYLEVGCKRYTPLQVHIHFDVTDGSENGLDGKKYPAEIHIVHKRVDTGSLLVLGAFIETTYEKPSSVGLAKMFSRLRVIRDPFAEKKYEVKAFPLYELLPYAGNRVNIYSRFELVNWIGSLTTPGCDGDVDWYMITGSALRMSRKLLDELIATKDCYGQSLKGNFRPFQEVKPYTRLYGTGDRL